MWRPAACDDADRPVSRQQAAGLSRPSPRRDARRDLGLPDRLGTGHKGRAAGVAIAERLAEGARSPRSPMFARCQGDSSAECGRHGMT
jgi:hypothetical protein